MVPQVLPAVGLIMMVHPLVQPNDGGPELPGPNRPSASVVNVHSGAFTVTTMSPLAA